jgi:hypothetical protein
MRLGRRSTEQVTAAGWRSMRELRRRIGDKATGLGLGGVVADMATACDGGLPGELGDGVRESSKESERGRGGGGDTREWN